MFGGFEAKTTERTKEIAMKRHIIAAFILLTLCAGCGTNQESRTTNQTTTISNDGYTWRVGATTMDGTNVPASQLRITAVHSTNAPPQTNEVSK